MWVISVKTFLGVGNCLLRVPSIPPPQDCTKTFKSIPGLQYHINVHKLQVHNMHSVQNVVESI